MSNVLVVLRSGDEAWLLEWETIVDAPASHGIPVSKVENTERIERALWYGTSLLDRNDITGEQFTLYNRAGKNETTLSREQIIDAYCRNKWGDDLPLGFSVPFDLSDEEEEKEEDIFNSKLEEWALENSRLGYDQPPRIKKSKDSGTLSANSTLEK